MNRTQIEWVRNPDGSQGYTWNPITGCLNHDNGLCKGGGFPCYAYKLANGRLKQRYLANKRIAQVLSPAMQRLNLNNPFYPRFWEERLMPKELGNPFDASYSRIKPRGIFVCDMGELFGDWIPETWQANIFNTIASHPYDRFYLLTKQPQNLIKFSPFPENCWVGVTATKFEALIGATKWLNGVKASVKYISIEPLLDWDLHEKALTKRLLEWGEVEWLIIGACTGTMEAMSSLVGKYFRLTLMHWKGNIWTAQPEIETIKEIVEAADQAGIPVFLKDNLKPIYIEHTKAQGQICSDYVLRQELPD